MSSSNKTNTAMTEIVCPFCVDPDPERLISNRDLPEDNVNVFRCRKCDLVFLAAENNLKQFDSEEFEYWNNEDQKKIYLDQQIQETFENEFKSHLTTLEKYFPQKGSILDVGCGVGHFLAQAKKRGWTVQGLDIAPAAKSAAKEIYGLHVEVGFLNSAPFVSGSFDVITLWDVIEHMRQPVENLNHAHQLLKEGGILVLKTPNERGLFKQTALALYRIFGDRAAFLLKYVYYLPHYFSYSEKSLNYLLKQCGFEMIRYELDETPNEFAEEKINVHYQKDPKRRFIISMLPFANMMSRLFRRGNKMIVYAKKVTHAG